MKLIKRNQYKSIHHTPCFYTGEGEKNIWKYARSQAMVRKQSGISYSKISIHPVQVEIWEVSGSNLTQRNRNLMRLSLSELLEIS